MNQQLKSVLEEQFLNKWIIIPVPERNQIGNLIPNKTVDAGGICQYIGSNKIMNYEIQVTIDGMPVLVKHINNIKLLPKNEKLSLSKY